MKDLNKELEKWRARHVVCVMLLKAIDSMDDPRKEQALETYREQQKIIDSKITELEKLERQRLGIPEPEPIVVSLKPATLLGNSKFTP